MNILRSESGAETVEIIIGIVVFVIFGLTVFSLVTKAAGNKAADIANCFAQSGSILDSSDTDDYGTDTTCEDYDSSATHNYTYNGEGGKTTA